jgi:tRNA A37 threonylcarbamoyladenosine dehydratase
MDGDALDRTNLERHLISTWGDVGTTKTRRFADTFSRIHGTGCTSRLPTPNTRISPGIQGDW